MTIPKEDNSRYQYQTLMHLLRNKSITIDVLKNLHTEVRHYRSFDGFHRTIPTRLALHTEEGMVSLGFVDDDLINRVIMDHEIENLIEGK